MKRLSKGQILMLHSQLTEQTGGSTGVRDFNLLESRRNSYFSKSRRSDFFRGYARRKFNESRVCTGSLDPVYIVMGVK